MPSRPHTRSAGLPFCIGAHNGGENVWPWPGPAQELLAGLRRRARLHIKPAVAWTRQTRDECASATGSRFGWSSALTTILCAKLKQAHCPSTRPAPTASSAKKTNVAQKCRRRNCSCKTRCFSESKNITCVYQACVARFNASGLAYTTSVGIFHK